MVGREQLLFLRLRAVLGLLLLPNSLAGLVYGYAVIGLTTPVVTLDATTAHPQPTGAAIYLALLMLWAGFKSNDPEWKLIVTRQRIKDVYCDVPC